MTGMGEIKEGEAGRGEHASSECMKKGGQGGEK